MLASIRNKRPVAAVTTTVNLFLQSQLPDVKEKKKVPRNNTQTTFQRSIVIISKWPIMISDRIRIRFFTPKLTSDDCIVVFHS